MNAKATKINYTRRQFVLSQFAAIIFDMFAAMGLGLIGYGVASSYSGTPWPVLDPVVKWARPLLTLLATIITAASIYFPINPVPPKIITKIWTAPIIILMCIVAFLYMVLWKTVLPETILQGFSVLGLSGG